MRDPLRLPGSFLPPFAMTVAVTNQTLFQGHLVAEIIGLACVLMYVYVCFLLGHTIQGHVCRHPSLLPGKRGGSAIAFASCPRQKLSRQVLPKVFYSIVLLCFASCFFNGYHGKLILRVIRNRKTL